MFGCFGKKKKAYQKVEPPKIITYQYDSGGYIRFNYNYGNKILLNINSLFYSEDF
jgi:hypothetical protein